MCKVSCRRSRCGIMLMEELRWLAMQLMLWLCVHSISSSICQRTILTAAVRGKSANHGVTHVSVLLSKILPRLTQTLAPPGQQHPLGSLRGAIGDYEEEMVYRTAPAVLTSRHACLEAHGYRHISDRGPLILRRAMVTQEQCMEE